MPREWKSWEDGDEGARLSAVCPWPTIDRVHDEVEIELVAPARRVVRAPAGTPIPAGWDTTLTDDGRRWWPHLAPFPMTATDAVGAWNMATGTDQTTTVLCPRDAGRVEVFRGLGGMARSLGQHTDPAIAWRIVDELRDSAHPAWLDRPDCRVVVATSPGWEAVRGGVTFPDTDRDAAWAAATG